MLADHLAHTKALCDEVESLRSKVNILEKRERLYETWIKHYCIRHGTADKVTRTKEELESLNDNKRNILCLGWLEISWEVNGGK